MNSNQSKPDPLAQCQAKWGQPKIIGRQTEGILYRCLRCQAAWVGPVGDWCDWCHERWIADQASNRRELLTPAWLNWDHRFHRLGPIDQVVWQSTRGYGVHYRESWLLKLETALNDSVITPYEFHAALGRYKRWMVIHLKTKPQFSNDLLEG